MARETLTDSPYTETIGGVTVVEWFSGWMRRAWFRVVRLLTSNVRQAARDRKPAQWYSGLRQVEGTVTYV
ncbi:MAG: hypothetical protein ACRD6B_06330 [Bryobacteraceae bacterium]